MDDYDDTYHAPQVAQVGDTRTLTFQTRILNQHLICTLCMGYYNDASTIIECLHTFCRVCIMRHFRESSFCPQCAKNLGPNPRDHVRTDRTLQSIVEKVFPQFSRQPGGGGPPPQHEEAATAAEEPTETAADADGEAGSGAAEPPRKRPRAGDAAVGSTDDAADADDGADGETGAASSGERFVPEEISFSLHELEGSAAVGQPLEKPFLRTKSALTIAHLRKYLSRKMSLPPDVPIEFFCSDAPLETSLTLAQIVTTMWPEEEANDLVLQYRVG